MEILKRLLCLKNPRYNEIASRKSDLLKSLIFKHDRKSIKLTDIKLEL